MMQINIEQVSKDMMWVQEMPCVLRAASLRIRWSVHANMVKCRTKELFYCLRARLFVQLLECRTLVLSKW